MKLLNVGLIIVFHKNEIFREVSMKFSNPNLIHYVRFCTFAFTTTIIVTIIIINNCISIHARVSALQVREQADVLSTGLPMRTAISTAQAARVRPVQRLSRNILRLVQVPVLLCVPLLRSAQRSQDYVAQSTCGRRHRQQQRPGHVVPEPAELLT